MVDPRIDTWHEANSRWKALISGSGVVDRRTGLNVYTGYKVRRHLCIKLIFVQLEFKRKLSFPAVVVFSV